MGDYLVEYERELEATDETTITEKFHAKKLSEDEVQIARHDGMDWNFLDEVPVEFLKEKLEELENENTDGLAFASKAGINAQIEIAEELIEHKKSKGLDKAEKHLRRAFDELDKCKEWIEHAREYIEETEER